tara:strand:+ start:544 stop:996 length:453 start_codon:yes stop_codon:yes gene_type:complete
MSTDFAAFNRDIKSLNSIGNDVSAYLTCYNDGKRGDDICDADTNTPERSMNQIRQAINDATITYDSKTKFSQDVTDLSDGINNYTDVDYDQLVTDHEEIKRKRNELDQKMRHVYEADNTDMTIMDNSSSYITLTWTVLAISLLYYLFRKL